MAQAQFTVAGQMFCLSFEGQGGMAGTLVRLDDGLEASFSSYECLQHLLEGVVGRRVWQALGEQILAELIAQCACA